MKDHTLMNTNVPEGPLRGPCPVCNGTGRVKSPVDMNEYSKRYGWYGYDANDDTVDCHNCGSQYQFGKPSGTVRLRSDGEPCEHTYTASKGNWNCTTNYRCIHCGDTYMIDSGG